MKTEKIRIDRIDLALFVWGPTLSWLWWFLSAHAPVPPKMIPPPLAPPPPLICTTNDWIEVDIGSDCFQWTMNRFDTRWIPRRISRRMRFHRLWQSKFVGLLRRNERKDQNHVTAIRCNNMTTVTVTWLEMFQVQLEKFQIKGSPCVYTKTKQQVSDDSDTESRCVTLDMWASFEVTVTLRQG